MNGTNHATLQNVQTMKWTTARDSGVVMLAQTPNLSEMSRNRMWSRLVVLTKAVLIVGMTMVGSLMPSVALGQVKLVAKAPVSSESLALGSRAHREIARPALQMTSAGTGADSSSTFNSEQGPGSGPIGPGPGCDLFPAPASVGSNVGLSYFGPSPSTVNPSLVGPVQFLNTGKVDATNGTITIPLYRHTEGHA